VVGVGDGQHVVCRVAGLGGDGVLCAKGCAGVLLRVRQASP
jgi:hypothetical protein